MLVCNMSKSLIGRRAAHFIVWSTFLPLKSFNHIRNWFSNNFFVFLFSSWDTDSSTSTIVPRIGLDFLQYSETWILPLGKLQKMTVTKRPIHISYLISSLIEQQFLVHSIRQVEFTTYKRASLMFKEIIGHATSCRPWSNRKLLTSSSHQPFISTPRIQRCNRAPFIV